jgi:hypothetical protein
MIGRVRNKRRDYREELSAEKALSRVFPKCTHELSSEMVEAPE